MATLNVGSMAARLGLDPSEFLDKMKGVQGFNGFVSGEMAREWKKTGRDGQEGMRLIDEALGIHVARPVARIVSETFPALGRAMSSILPGVAFTALGVAIFEFVDGISKKMDEAKRKQEEYTEAVQKTKLVIGETDAASELRIDKAMAKAAALRGDMKGEAHFKGLVADAEAVDQMAKSVDKLVEAELREARTAEARKQVWAEMEVVAHELFSTESSLNVGKINDQMERFGREFDIKSIEDQIRHTTTAFTYLAQETKRAHDELAALQANAGKTVAIPSVGMGAAPQSRALASPDEIAAAKKRADTFDEIQASEKRRQTAANDEKTNEITQAAKAHSNEVRSELEAIERLGQTSRAAAASASLLASATGKGTAETILATAAAEAQKKILDATAEANTKLFSDTKRPVSSDKRIQSKLAEYAVIERGNALTSAAARAAEELNRAIAEQSTHDNERISALAGEAEGHSRVAVEQAKELAGLIPLQQKLQALRDLRAGLNQPAIGPPTAVAAQLDSQISQASAALAAETNKKINVVNPQIQLAAFREELEKIRDQTASLAAAQLSPWAKIDADVQKLVSDGKVLPSEIAETRQRLIELQNVKIAGEFEKLAEKVKEARIETAALATGSPFAKLDAEAQKLGREFGLDAEKIAVLRNGLIELQATQNVGKAFAGVDALNGGGSRMLELQQQMDAMRRASTSGQTDDGTALSAASLAAVRLEMRAITDEQDKLLLKTGDIDVGIKAWADDMQKVQSAGELTFEALTQASKGFEDTAAKSLMTVMDSQRGEQRKLIADLEKMWSQYFNSLAQMGMKKGMDQLLAPLGKAISGGFGQDKSKPAPNLAPTSAGSLTGLGALIPKAGAGSGAASLTSAGTVLHAAATALLSAATALRASAAGGVGGGAGASPIPFFGGGAGDGADAGAAIPFFAAGGDATPGSSFISGEAGAEQVDLDRSGGAHITPLGGGGTQIHNYADQFRGAVVTEDLMRRADAAHMMKASEGRMMQAMPAMQREIALRKRT
jgi:hypothetical protein